MFIGREHELKRLNQLFSAKKGKLVCCYGRRRIGKSCLIREFGKGKDIIYIEGLEGESTKQQIRAFLTQLSVCLKNPFLAKLGLHKWDEVFEYLTQNVFNNKKKYILALDELQWLAAGQSKLINQIKVFWDLHWKDQGVMLILCGSVAHFMVKKVIKSKSLYGRIDHEFLIEALTPAEITKLLPNKSDSEILKYLLVFGGVPKYYDVLERNKSFEQNINDLCFCKGGFFTTEFEKVFFSQFKEHQTYKKIVILLSKKNLTLEEVAKALGLSSGGSLKSFFDNLELTGFVGRYNSLNKTGRKNQKYKLLDPFLRFYFTFMQDNISLIQNNRNRNLIREIFHSKMKIWQGFAFEIFCLNNWITIAEVLEVKNLVRHVGPIFSPKLGVQVDLAFERTDDVFSLFEIKYYDAPVEIGIIKEIKKKVERLEINQKFSIEKILVSPFGASKSLKECAFFDHVIDLKMLLK